MTDELVKLRKACLQDIPDITKIYAHAVENGTASFELEAPNEEEMSARFNKIISDQFPYIVAVNSERVIGYAYAGSFRPRPAYRWCVESTIYVAPDVQGQGVGAMLLSRLIDTCEKMEFRQMMAVIGGAEHHASIKLHLSFGFRKVGQYSAVGWKHGQWHDSVIMQLALGEGSNAPPAELDKRERPT